MKTWVGGRMTDRPQTSYTHVGILTHVRMYVYLGLWCCQSMDLIGFVCRAVCYLATGIGLITNLWKYFQN